MTTPYVFTIHYADSTIHNSEYTSKDEALELIESLKRTAKVLPVLHHTTMTDPDGVVVLDLRPTSP